MVRCAPPREEFRGVPVVGPKVTKAHRLTKANRLTKGHAGLAALLNLPSR